MYISAVLSALLSTFEIIANVKEKGKVSCCQAVGLGAEDENLLHVEEASCLHPTWECTGWTVRAVSTILPTQRHGGSAGGQQMLPDAPFVSTLDVWVRGAQANICHGECLL